MAAIIAYIRRYHFIVNGWPVGSVAVHWNQDTPLKGEITISGSGPSRVEPEQPAEESAP